MDKTSHRRLLFDNIFKPASFCNFGPALTPRTRPAACARAIFRSKRRIRGIFQNRKQSGMALVDLAEVEGDGLSQVTDTKKGKLAGFPFIVFGLCGWSGSVVPEHLVHAFGVQVELKCVDEIHPVHVAQVLSYMKLMPCKVGYLINFNVRLLKEGIKRLVL